MKRTVTNILNQVHHKTDSTLGRGGFNVPYGQPLMPSVNFSSAYSFQSTQDLKNYHQDKYNSQRYCRDSNALTLQLEKYFEAFYPNKSALLYSSGMSAISSVLDVVTEKNSQIIISSEVYRKTRDYINFIEQRSDVTVRQIGSINEFLNTYNNQDNYVVFLEMPSNPHMRIYDFEKLYELKKNKNIKIILDITFSGLLNNKTDMTEVDAIIHSCTKYIGGHNDVIAGVALVNHNWRESMWLQRSQGGGILDPMTSYLLLRSLRTYDLRIEKQLNNMKKLKEYLATGNKVNEIFYPGEFQNKNQQELFNQLFHHGGSVISFICDFDVNQLEKRFSLLKSIKMAPSFGSLDSLIEIPSMMSHFGKNDEDLAKIGLERNLIRLSVGCEPLDYLVEDLDNLLNK